MKRAWSTWIVAGIVSICPGQPVSAQPPASSPPRWSMQSNLLSAVLGTYTLAMEYRLGGAYSIGPEIQWSYMSFGEVKQVMSGGGVRLNIKLGGPAFSDGWYLGPSLRYLTGEIRNGNDRVTTGALVGGTVFGFQKWWTSGFNLRLGAGIFYSTLGRFVSLRNPGGTVSQAATPGIAEIHPGMELVLGYSF